MPPVEGEAIDVLHGKSPAVQPRRERRQPGQTGHTGEQPQLVAEQHRSYTPPYQGRARRVVLDHDRRPPFARDEQHIGVAKAATVEDADPRTGEIAAVQGSAQRATSASIPRPTTSAVPISWLSEKRTAVQLVCSLWSAAKGTNEWMRGRRRGTATA